MENQALKSEAPFSFQLLRLPFISHSFSNSPHCLLTTLTYFTCQSYYLLTHLLPYVYIG